MPLMLINAPDDVAVEAVRHLARIEVLAVVESTAPAAKPAKRRSWAGLLPQEAGERMLREIAGLRDEWEQNI